MDKIYKKRLDNVKPYIPGKPIEDVKRELGLDSVVKLASNESPFPPSKKAIEAALKAIEEGNRYPDGYCYKLRKKLAEFYSLELDNFVFGNGSDEVLVLAVRAFAGPGDEVMIADPTFMVYSIAATVEGATVVKVPMKNFKYDLKAMAQSITDKTKLIFLANPDNPLGTYVNKDELDEFLSKVPSNIVVVLDEAYYEFAKGDDYPDTIPLLGKTKAPLLIVRTFSKTYGLAGLRVGYGIAEKDMIEVLNKVREPFNVNAPAQAAAVAALDDQEYVEDIIAYVKKEKKRFYDLFEKADLKYIPSKTNFILFDTKSDGKKVAQDLLVLGVIVREMTPWGLNGFIRVNVGLAEENDKFFENLTKVLA